MKPGFYALKNAKEKMVVYSKYYLIPGVWIPENPKAKRVACWATYTPDKKLIGCSTSFLSAKDRVKSHKISLIMSR